MGRLVEVEGTMIVLSPRPLARARLMTIVDQYEQPVHPIPPAVSVRPVRSPAIRRRNRRWLALRRRDDLTVRELAKAVGQPAATVAAGLLWAEVEEERREAAIVASFQSPVLCEFSGITLEDLIHLDFKFPPGTALGDDPQVRAVLDPLLAKVSAWYERCSAVSEFRKESFAPSAEAA